MKDTYLVVEGTVYDLVPRQEEPLDRKPSIAQTRESINTEEREYVDSIGESGDDPTYCKLHAKYMKQRMKKDGGSWNDHRRLFNGVWQKCSGNGYR